MNCDKCLFLTEEQKCKLEKHLALKPIYKDGVLTKLTHDCIFKNTEYDINYEQAHLFAKTRIAVAGYYHIKEESDIDNMFNLLNKESQYPQNLMAQFNAICTKLMPIDIVKNLAFQLQQINQKRLWNLEIIFDNQWDNNEFVEVPNFILDTCKLPFFTILNYEYQFSEIKNFEYFCMSNPVPNIYGNIKNISYMRKLLESLDNVEDKEECVI